MAYSTDDGLPGMYEVDWSSYLKSNLYGKINKLFDMNVKELEKEINER